MASLVAAKYSIVFYKKHPLVLELKIAAVAIEAEDENNPERRFWFDDILRIHS